ncbi:rho GTPase-activating protein 21-like [Sycon ciliatum]|uniref:rho GTPase-activating protein 21-like n=1 Tax=Sycon ciliatum TaxID=27933 RepID=UPI0031F71315
MLVQCLGNDCAVIDFLQRRGSANNEDDPLVSRRMTTAHHQSQQLAVLQKKKVVTVGGNFMVSLSSLMASLSVAEPYFVRCIKSNPNQKPMVFDDKKVMEQLHYLGMVDTIKVRRMGYNLRYPHEDFLSQMRLIISPDILKQSTEPVEKVKEVLKVWNVERRVAQVGKTKVFLRTELTDRLTAQINERLVKYVLVMQRLARAAMARRQFLAIRKGIVAIQSWWRRVLRHRAVRAQRAEQAKQAKQLASVIKIQSMLRACLARQQFAKMQQAHRESEQREKVKETGQAVFAAAASAAKRKASVVAENIAKAAEAAAAAASEAEAAAAAAKKAAEAVVAAADRAEKERKDAEKERKDAEKEHKETKQFAGVRSSASVISLEDAVEAVVAQNKKTAAIERTTSSTQSLDQSPKKASPDKSSSAGAAKPQLQKNRFYSQLVSSPSKKLVKREGHEFRITVFNLPTTCELCKEPITPHLVEGGVCEACHYAVHQQCIINTQKQCKVSKDSSGNRVWEGTVFGASLTQLLVLKDNPVPLLLERCFEQIESRGDKTTDIYKNIPLDQTRLKALKKLLGEDPEKTDIRKTDVHLLCGIVKLFFRELPDPVVPYHMYRDFINTTAVTDVHQQCTEVRDLIEVLPCSHQFALRRLLSHLAVVVTYKDARITAHSLAAVFAPLILSTPKTVKAAESLKHVKLRLRLVENLITTMSARPSFLSDESMDYDDDEGNDSDDDYSGSGFVSPAASSLVISRGSVSSVNTLAPDVQPSLTSTSIPRKAGALNMLGTKTDSDSAISTLGEDSATSSPPPLTSSQSVSSIRNAFQQSLAVTGPGLSSAKSDSGRDSASTDSTSGVKSQACSTSNSTTSAVGTVESSSSRSRVAGLSNKFGHVDKSPTKPPPPVARTKSSIGISMGEESNKAAVARAKPSIGISSGEESNKAAVASAKSSMGINSGKESNNAAVARAKSSIGISSGEESNKAAVARASSSIGISSGEESNTAAVARAKPSIGISWGEESKKAADPDAVTAENASSKPCPVAGKLSTISEKFQKSTESAEPARSSAKPLAPVGASIVSRLRASSTSQISSKVKRAPIFKSPLSTSPPNGSPGNAGSASGSDCENSNQSSKSGVSNLSAMFNKSEDPVARSRKRASLCGSETESELRAALENVLEKGKTFEPGAERGLKSAKSESPKPKIKLPAALQDCGATLPISLSPLQSPHQRSPVRSPVQSPGSSPASPATSPKPALPPKRRESLVFNFDITKERRSSLQSTQSPDAPPAIPQCRSSAGFLSGESSPVSLPTTPLGSAPSSPAISPRNSPPSSPAISPRNSPRRAVRKKKPPPLPGSELQSPRSEPPPLPGSQPRSEPGSPPSDLPPPPLTPPSPMSPMSSKSSLPSMLPQVSAETATPVEEKIDMPELAVATPLHSATKSRPANRGRRPPTRGHRQKMAVTEEAD